MIVILIFLLVVVFIGGVWALLTGNKVFTSIKTEIVELTIKVDRLDRLERERSEKR